MRKFIILCSLVAVFILPASHAGSDWRTDAITEQIAITATAATSDEVSALIQKPRGATGVVAWINVTVGASLLLDLNTLVYSPTVEATIYFTNNCPSDGGITGTGNWACFYGNFPSTNGYAIVTDKAVVVPTYFKFLVDHGNANEATYVVYYQWLW